MPLQFVHPIQRATHRIALYLEALQVRDLTQGEAHVLALLAQKSPIALAELHRGLAHKRSTLTSILDRLTNRGFVRRQVRETDRRSFAVSLTAKGRKLALRINRHLTGFERKIVQRASLADIRGFHKTISALEDVPRSPSKR